MMFGLGLGLQIVGGGLNPSAALLAALSDGAAQLIMHPLEYGSMFQDRAGTMPVTESGQLVGQVLDIGGGDFHATAISDAARGVFAVVPEGGRRNMLTFTEQFDNAYWARRRGAFSADSVLAPNGTMTADTFVEDTATGVHDFYNGVGVSVQAGVHTASVYIKPRGRTFVRFVLDVGGSAKGAYFNLTTGDAFNVNVAAGYTASAVLDASGFWRLSLTATFAATTLFFSITSAEGSSTSLVGLNAAAFDVWGAQLELGSTVTAYQRVGSQYDVTEAGVPSLNYVAYNGVNTAYQTSALPAPGVDKAQVFAGVRKESDAGMIVAETSVNTGGNSGAFYFVAGTDSSAQYSSVGRGTATVSHVHTARITGFFAPDTAFFTATHDISGDLSTIRRNGVAGTDGIGDKGGGNFNPAGTYPIYYGARAGTTVFFNGNHYRTLGPIVRFGTNATPEQIAAAEAYYTAGLPS